ncbi:hypothetical protein niasHT_040032 [Heterodera trifolii]|uniref:Uncharacterized protein n=1 Tax=Heterodera trifolii TaxID=157864 RepID=A0ABD2J5J5_9BILA
MPIPPASPASVGVVVVVLLGAVVFVVDAVVPNLFTNLSLCPNDEPGPLCDPYDKLPEDIRRQTMRQIKELKIETDPYVKKLDTERNKSPLLVVDTATLSVRYEALKPCPIFGHEIAMLIANNDHLLQLKWFDTWIEEMLDGMHAIVTERHRILYGLRPTVTVPPAFTAPSPPEEECPKQCHEHTILYAFVAFFAAVICSVAISRKFG